MAGSNNRYRSGFDLPFPGGWDRRAFYSHRYAVLPCCVAVVLLIPLSAVVLELGRLVRGTADAGTLLGAGIWTAVTVGVLCALWRAWPKDAVVQASTVITGPEAQSALAIPVRLPSRVRPVALAAGGVLLIGCGVWFMVWKFGTDPSLGYLGCAGLSTVGALGLFLARHTFRPHVTRANTGILLTPRQLRTDHGTGPITLDWTDISGIHAAHVRNSPATLVTAAATNMIVVLVDDPAVLGPDDPTTTPDERFPDAGYLAYEIPHQQIDTDPTLVFHALRYYLHHGEHRRELGTDAALRRFRKGHFAVPGDSNASAEQTDPAKSG
ncbi:hypothetical protein [Nocardia brasiliensis]|uniref:hypothetical protein n=1 Tax=Nocardia brasiliensis TaxID=37326 RepID=UPI0033C4BB02